jgi:hypothetical protein
MTRRRGVQPLQRLMDVNEIVSVAPREQTDDLPHQKLGGKPRDRMRPVCSLAPLVRRPCHVAGPRVSHPLTRDV